MKRLLTNYFLRNIIGVISPDEVINYDNKGQIFIGKNLITKQELKTLQSEIKALESMELWKYMNETVRYHAVHKAIHEATNFEHVLAGKMALWTLDLFNSIINVIKNKSVV